MVVDSDNPYVKTYAPTEAGKISAKLGASDTAQYYARTMNVSGLNKAGHFAIYTNILTKVDPDYKEVDYNWNNTMAK